MAEKISLHITNGSSLTKYLNDLEFEGEILTWNEMLCEGPTVAGIPTPQFLDVRKKFFKETYNLEFDEDEFKKEFDKLEDAEIKYAEIILWFEYDLFCHINMIAVISLLHQLEINLPLYLVMSGRVEEEQGLKALSELSPEQLFKHYKKRIKLSEEDKDLALSLWRTYSGKDHNLFVPQIVKKSSFPYLSNCLKAHLQRFPDSKSGLNAIEENILKIIDKEKVKSSNQLIGYALNYQGYYGYGDLQLERIIDKLSIFFEGVYQNDSRWLQLNRKGHEALLGSHNFAYEINNDLYYGGIRSLDYVYDKKLKKLLKTPINAN